MRTRRTILGEQALLQPENTAVHAQIPTESVTPLAAAHQLQPQNSSYYGDPLDVPSNQNQSRTTDSEPAYITTYGGRNKRKRGRRGPTVMRDVWEQPQEERMLVSFNSSGQPNDKNTASLLANFLGTVARNGNNAPLQFKKWAKMPESYKEDMLKIVKLKFVIPEGSDDFIIKSLSDKWRNWKSALRKMHFDPTKSVEEHLSKVPPRVEKDQWKELVLYWFSPEGMDASARNTNNRKRQKSIHRTGTRSFAVAKEIEREKLGREPTRDDLLTALYVKSKTAHTNDATGEATGKSKELLSEGIQGSSSGMDRNNAFSQPMGEETLEPVHMHGLSESRGASYSLAMEYKAAFENMQKHCGELNKKLEEVQSGVGNNDSPVVQAMSVNRQNRSFASTSVFRPIQEVSSSEKEKQYWTKEHLEIFCKLCLEHSEQIHLPGVLFDEQLWRNISQLLKKLTGESYYGSGELKSKWYDLKQEWQKWKQLIDGEINLRWNPQKNTVDASEEWWRQKIQMNPEFRSFRTKGIPPSLESLLDSMFMNTETRSQDSPSNFNDDFADDSNDDDDDMRSADVNIDKIIADLSSKSKIVLAEPIDSSNLMMNKEIGQNTAELRLNKTKNTSKKKSKESVKLKNQLDKLYSAVVENSKSLVNVSHDRPPSKEMTYADFVEVLEEIPEVEQDDGLHFFALDHLKEKMNQVIFKSFKSDEKRVNWLKHEFKKQK